MKSAWEEVPQLILPCRSAESPVYSRRHVILWSLMGGNEGRCEERGKGGDKRRWFRPSCSWIVGWAVYFKLWVAQRKYCWAASQNSLLGTRPVLFLLSLLLLFSCLCIVLLNEFYFTLFETFSYSNSMSAIPIFWNYHIMFGISSYFWCWFQERLDINIWLESSQNLVLAAATAANSFNLLKYLLTSKLGFMFKKIKKWEIFSKL